MKITRFAILIGVVALAAISNLQAQKPEAEKSREDRAKAAIEQNIEKMREGLDLSAEQEAKVRVILEERAAARAANMKNQELSREARKENMKKIDDAANERIKGVLGPIQGVKYNAYISGEQKKREERAAKPPSGKKGKPGAEEKKGKKGKKPKGPKPAPGETQEPPAAE